VLDALRDLILLQLNTTEPEGKELSETFKVRAVPTFALLDAEGQPLDSWVGYGRPQSWTERLAEALEEPITIAQRQARYRSTPNFRDALFLGKNAYREGSYREAHSYYRQAEMLDSTAARKEEVELLIFRAIFSGVGAGQFEVEQAGREVEKILSGKTVKPEYALEVAERLIGVRGQVGDLVIVPYLKMAYPFIRDIDDPDLKDRRQWVLAEYALIVEQDPGKALELKRASFPEGWRSDPDALNEFAWWCFENRIDVEEAVELSRRSIELSQPGPEQANYLDTLAELVNLQGDPKGALDLIDQALQMNPESRYLKNQQAKFRDILGEQHQQEPSS
jgi:tetratricopeptide (TPR) repeat protein